MIRRKSMSIFKKRALFHSSLLIIAILLSSCSPAPSSGTPEIAHIEYTFSANAWLYDLYGCAPDGLALSVDLRAADMLDPFTADLMLRIGLPSALDLTAYQVGEETIQVVVHRENPLPALTAEQILALFSGRVTNWSELGGADMPVQIWTFAPGEDVEVIFRAAALGDAPISSLARLAPGPDELALAVSQDRGAVGFLPAHWVAGNVRALRLPADLTAALTVPVLVLSTSEPEGALREALACLQDGYN